LEGLYLTSFDPSRILVNKKVKEFYRKLSEVQQIQSAEAKPVASLEPVPVASLEPVASLREPQNSNVFENFAYVAPETVVRVESNENSDNIAQ